MTRENWRRAAARLGLLGAAVLLSALAGCGGGSTVASTGVGTGGTGISVGTVTGFGSVVIEGQAYDSEAPRYFNDDTPGTAQPATAVALGQRLQLVRDASGSAALIEPELIGPVQSIAAGNGSFTINGLRVLVHTDPATAPVTFYAGLAGFASLQSGMVVQVDGAFGVDATGQPYLQATRIAQLPTGTQASRLTGVVSGWNAALGSFQLGTVNVQLGNGAQVYPAGSSIRDGELVNVRGDTPVSSNSVMQAAGVRVRTLLGASGTALIGGVVTLPSTGGVQIAGIPIAAGNATAAAQLAALGAGEYVTVQGQVAGDGASVLASSVLPYASQPGQISLRGNITGYVDAGHFLVRGVPVDASQVAFSGVLGNGAFVQVQGNVDAQAPNTVLASSLQLLPLAPDGGTEDLTGTISQYDAGAQTFVLSWSDDGTTAASMVTLSPNVVFSNGGLADLADNKTVEVEATNTGSGLVAYSVAFKPQASSNTLQTSGRIYNLVPGTSLQLNGLLFDISSASVSGGTLANGDDVDMSFTQSGGTNQAVSITIDP